ncbi:S53 family peptidase [Nocardioides acrostichi]|uniref:S53 family peptidase n=1 Tax=Nocardioides acrostichi TaxID=2784339 RepID=A0A930UY26_9ACTN|nr:S53 family peptidase [Nocardioides acrostichi]MBF4162221.1 S53 family peptidase [Nocardioides acrostichi]
MKKSVLLSFAASAALATSALAGVVGSPAASAAPAAVASSASPTGQMHSQRLCSSAAAAKQSVATAACGAKIVVNGKGNRLASTTPPSTGLTPAGLQDAYKLTGLTSGGRTVAIVDAYGYPNLERDLATYRSQFGLPACTTANGCLKIVDQNGGTSYPRTDVGWGGEQALDVDAVSAACPDCKIVVVQAKTASFANLGTAVQTAAKQSGVVAISNSYGGGDAADTTYGKYYDFPGIAVTASTGDNGYQGGSYPASSAYVTAVGGTSLVKASNTRGWSESVWDGAGSGCSTYNTALAAASSYDTGCSKRAMADVSAAADPSNGGLAVYYPTSRNASTWGQIGGTSESSPIIASVYALSGNTSGYANAIPYANSGQLFDVTSGSNGTCPTTQWCNARAGWDGPTGLGTPNGVGAF